MAETAKKQNTKKKSKKPASFSKNVESKKTTKKATKKTEEKAPKVESNFSEFETMKIEAPKKAESKIVLRDVEKETPVKKAPDPDLDLKKIKFVTATPVATPIMPVTPATPPKLTAKEVKEKEIEKAIKSATRLPVIDTRRRKKGIFGEFGWARVLLVTACITTIIFALAYIVNVVRDNTTLQYAAAQSGIDAVYPSYIPRGYELSDVTSTSGRITMHFKGEDGAFEISEESSSWDSEGLLNNYIKKTYGNDFTVLREQGLSIYMGSSWEAWVNGGVLYKLTVSSGELTKKQMKTIATSF